MSSGSESAPRPVVLCVLDGWGYRPDPADNAVAAARKPNFDRLIATCPQGLIDASELYVGLPAGQMGNSEVGHMNLGAGRVVMQDLPRIDQAIQDGSLAANPELRAFGDRLKAAKGTCHLMGLVSPGGVHSHQDQIAALANMVAEAGVPVTAHAFLDGRDTPPKNAREHLAAFARSFKPGLPIRIGTCPAASTPWIATSAGPCHRAGPGERRGRAATPDAAVAQGYAADLTDEFVRYRDRRLCRHARRRRRADGQFPRRSCARI